MDRDDFVTALEDGQKRHATVQDSAPTGSEVLQPEWWEADAVAVGGKGGTVPEATGDYILIEHSDAVDALASFIAAYIVALPEGRGMEPKELQRAVQQALKEMRKGRVRRLWDWGRFAYRAVALSYGAFAAYTNPW